MQAIAVLVSSLLLVAAFAGAAPSQPEQVPSGQVVSSAPVVGNSPNSVVGGQVDAGQQQPSPVVVEHSHVIHQHQPVAGYYSPVVVQPAGQPEGVQVVGVKPPVRNSASLDQYGQPESAALPPNYKPFGSWGLYIGGNPADGYYTNYYKALSNSVDKQVVEPAAGGAAKPVVGAAQSPVLTRQALVPASSSPYVGGDFYSFAYSPSDLNSALPVHGVGQQQHAPPAPVGQFYGAPAASPVEPAAQFGSVSPYADFYATKKIGQAALAQREVAAQVPKGHHQQRSYYYQYPAASPVQLSGMAGQQKPQQVVGYPVPVGSQIVGSQPGVDGAFDPYGIHAFTRYAVKPTVVSQADSSYYYSYPTAHQQHAVAPVPSYKQQQPVYSVPVHAANAYSPYYGFYGYPVNQLHYSQGLIVPEHQAPSHHQSASGEASAPGPLSPSEPSSDKVDSNDQLKPQK